MKLDIISIGDELLIGQTLNTNAHWIATTFNNIGFEIRQHITVADTEEAILNALENALENIDVAIITGGLGPTNDDLTMPVLNNYFGGDLVEDEVVLNDISNFVLSRGGEMNKNNISQATVPDNCKVVRNFNGTAPGLWFEKDNKVVVAMPGVPSEMKAMVTDSLLPWLLEKYELPEILHQMVYTQGISEAKLAEVLAGWEEGLPRSIKLAYLPSPGRVKLRLTTIGENRNDLQSKIDSEIIKLKNIIPKFIYSVDNESIAQVISDLFHEKNITLATAESCTGGYIAHLITSISGSSNYFKGSIVSYANEIKTNELKVLQGDIDRFGAVSQQVVEQMAMGVLNKMDTDYAVSTSGVAGPLGGSDEKPVGTVWIAVASKNGVISKKFLFGNDRAINIQKAAITALNMLRKELD